MGQPKQAAAKMPSDNFLLKQRIRANSRQASSVRPSPMSGRSQAELDRKPLTTDEITAMFVGAPYFNVEKKKSTYKPQVIFRGGDVEAAAQYATDYPPFSHSSFAACTMGLHRTKETAVRPPSRSFDIQAPRVATSTFLEIPNMLSAQGNDLGTIGFDHYLQLPVADSTVLPDEPTFFEKRKLLYSDPEDLGLRDFNLESLIDRLTELGEIHATYSGDEASSAVMSEDKVSEMGEELFGKLLSAELGTTPAGTGSVSLKTQIDALQKVLNTSELFHDFGLVEWRIRVGQLLWASHDTEEPQLDENRQPTERDVLLLQITLAAELLVRLEAMKTLGADGTSFPPIISAEERATVETEQTTKIRWDLLLAERFLDSLTISAKLPRETGKERNRHSFFSAISFFTAKEDGVEGEQLVKPLLFPKDETNQLAGLLRFAEAISWPHREDVSTQLEAKLAPPKSDRPVSMVSVYATPLSSPGLPVTPGFPGQRSSYFGGGDAQATQQPRRPGLSRINTAASMQLLPASGFGTASNSESFEVGGWLSRSWLAGLVLPGEAASHFLISTLLENSPQAIDALGDCANLYGGFAYRGRSYWSKSCVVGRVLAASREAQECMGWVSVPVNPKGIADGWINLNVKDIPYAPAHPRIKEAEIIAADSDPLRSHSPTQAQAGDFTTPIDGPLVMGNEVRFDSLAFNSSGSTYELTKQSESLGATNTSIAQLTFSSPINSKLANLTVPLTYDVYFVSSYPCYPGAAQKPRDTKVLPTNGIVEAQDAKKSLPADSARPSASTLSFDGEKELPNLPAHPLHIDYRFNNVPVATLMSTAESRAPALSSPGERPHGQYTDDEDEEVVILDCRGSQDLQLLARAWCSKSGENAVVAKSGRTCLACSVREARALGIGVIIRI